jgi:hypothetical protein
MKCFATFKLDREFDESLKEPKSKQYTDLSQDITTRIRDNVKTSIDCEDVKVRTLRFYPGSVMVDVEVAVQSENPGEALSKMHDTLLKSLHPDYVIQELTLKKAHILIPKSERDDEVASTTSSMMSGTEGIYIVNISTNVSDDEDEDAEIQLTKVLPSSTEGSPMLKKPAELPNKREKPVISPIVSNLDEKKDAATPSPPSLPPPPPSSPPSLPPPPPPSTSPSPPPPPLSSPPKTYREEILSKPYAKTSKETLKETFEKDAVVGEEQQQQQQQQQRDSRSDDITPEKKASGPSWKKIDFPSSKQPVDDSKLSVSVPKSISVKETVADKKSDVETTDKDAIRGWKKAPLISDTLPSLSIECPSSPSPVSSEATSPRNSPPIVTEKDHFFKKTESEPVATEAEPTKEPKGIKHPEPPVEEPEPVAEPKRGKRTPEAELPYEESWMNTFESFVHGSKNKSSRKSESDPIEQQVVSPTSPTRVFNPTSPTNTSERPTFRRSVSLKDKLAGLVEQVKEGDSSYDHYIKDAESQGRKIVRTGKTFDFDEQEQIEEISPERPGKEKTSEVKTSVKNPIQNNVIPTERKFPAQKKPSEDATTDKVTSDTTTDKHPGKEVYDKSAASTRLNTPASVTVYRKQSDSRSDDITPEKKASGPSWKKIDFPSSKQPEVFEKSASSTRLDSEASVTVYRKQNDSSSDVDIVKKVDDSTSRNQNVKDKDLTITFDKKSRPAAPTSIMDSIYPRRPSFQRKESTDPLPPSSSTVKDAIPVPSSKKDDETITNPPTVRSIVEEDTVPVERSTMNLDLRPNSKVKENTDPMAESTTEVTRSPTLPKVDGSPAEVSEEIEAGKLKNPQMDALGSITKQPETPRSSRKKSIRERIEQLHKECIEWEDRLEMDKDKFKKLTTKDKVLQDKVENDSKYSPNYDTQPSSGYGSISPPVSPLSPVSPTSPTATTTTTKTTTKPPTTTISPSTTKLASLIKQFSTKAYTVEPQLYKRPVSNVELRRDTSSPSYTSSSKTFRLSDPVSTTTQEDSKWHALKIKSMDMSDPKGDLMQSIRGFSGELKPVAPTNLTEGRYSRKNISAN